MGIKQQAAERRKVSLDQAIDMCGKYFEFDPIQIVDIDGEDFEIPFSSLYSREQIERFDELDKFVKNELDHEDVLERNAVTGEPLVHPDTGEALTKSLPKEPYQIDGEEIDPDYGLRWLTALWGDEGKARRAEAAGLTFGAVQMIQGRMGAQFAEWQRKRERTDSKSR